MPLLCCLRPTKLTAAPTRPPTAHGAPRSGPHSTNLNTPVSTWLEFAHLTRRCLHVLETSVVVKTVRKARGHGLNVDTGQVDDLVKAGISDPTMVTCSALQNAASIAKNILMTDAILAEPPEKQTAGAGMSGMGGMGDMM